MNPSNPFGSPQGGAFQVQSSNPKPGLFQSFGQQSATSTSTASQPQSLGFFQRSAFGQPASVGGPAFSQNPSSFGQSAQPSSTAAVPQAPAFGLGGPVFGSGTAPAFGQPSSSNPSSAFGQVPAFGQVSGFSKQPVNFGLQPSGFGDAPMTSSPNPNPGAGQTQSLGFGQPLFGQASSTPNAFGAVQSVSQSRGFDVSGFTFKPSNEALFKPIFSASPEPTNPQSTAMSGSAFGGGASQTSGDTVSTGGSSSSTTTAPAGFSLLTGAKSGPVGFSFSQPAATPAALAKSNPISSNEKTGPSSSVQFTFSQPAAPSGSSPQASQPTTPSSFSFSLKPPQASQAAGFGDGGAEGECGSSLADTNVFARLSKGTKRKEEPPSSGPVNPDAEESPAAETDSLRHQPKRALLRSRGPAGGLFGRALSDLRRDTPSSTTSSTIAPPPKYALTKEMELHSSLWEETGEEQEQQSTGTPAAEAAAPTQSQDAVVKTEFVEKTGEI